MSSQEPFAPGTTRHHILLRDCRVATFPSEGEATEYLLSLAVQHGVQVSLLLGSEESPSQTHTPYHFTVLPGSRMVGLDVRISDAEEEGFKKVVSSLIAYFDARISIQVSEFTGASA